MIVLSGLSKNYGPNVLFEGVSLQLNGGERYGLVGANGSGKSTLMRMLANEESPTEGSITIPKKLRLGILRQDQFADDANRIVEVAMAGDQEVFAALAELDRLEHTETPDAERVSALADVLARHDGYTLEPRSRAVLDGLGIDQSVQDNPLGTLSGGFKLRVLLAQVLMSRPDVMLLDEPTNHLDILSIRWLEEFLRGYTGCAVIISHDRRFLDSVTTRILDVDYKTVTDYPGSYDQFVRQKDETRRRNEVELARAEKEIAIKQAFIDRFKAKATKARQAQSRAKQIEKIEVREVPRTSRRAPAFSFAQGIPSGKEVLFVEGISKSYGENHVLSQVEFSIQRGERVAIIGANGIGKSTLLKVIADRIAPDGGAYRWGHNTVRGYFAQDHRDLLTDPKQTPLHFVWDACPAETMTYVRGQLGRMLFSGGDVDKPAAALSGGEAARVVFGRLMVQKPNVLMLDEPTNHLDLESIDALTEALLKYDGTLIFVSHDRHFVAQLATRIIELRPRGLQDFRGGYDDYVRLDGDDHLDVKAVVLKAVRDRQPAGGAEKKKSQLGWEEQKKLANRKRALPKRRDKLMVEIEEAEKEKTEIAARYAEPTFYMQTPFDEIEKLQKRQDELSRKIEEIMASWEEVEKEIAELDAETL